MGRTPPVDEAVFMHDTGHICADCGEALLMGEIVVVLQIVLPQTDGQCPVFETSEGFAYEPVIYHDGCWWRLHEQLTELLERPDLLETAGRRQPESYEQLRALGQPAVQECFECKAGICAMEPSGLLTEGEFVVSRRAPEGGPTMHFEASRAGAKLLCLSCTRTVHDEIIGMWDNGISFSGECAECTYTRIWRFGIQCTHEPDDDEEDEETEEEEEEQE